MKKNVSKNVIKTCRATHSYHFKWLVMANAVCFYQNIQRVCVCVFIGVRMRKQKALSCLNLQKCISLLLLLFSSTTIRVRNSPLFWDTEKIKLKKLFPFVYLHTLGDVQCIRYLNLLFFHFVFTSPFLFNNFFQVFSFVAKRYKKNFFFISLLCVLWTMCMSDIFFFRF